MMYHSWQLAGQVGQGHQLPEELAYPDDSLLETIAVNQGKLVWFDRHRQRLRASSLACFGHDPGDITPLPPMTSSWCHRSGRLRCLHFAGGSTAWTFQEEKFPVQPLRVATLEVTVPFGRHKSGDRTRQEQLLSEAGKLGAAEALLVLGGELLEGTYTTLFLHDCSGWLTPRLDGRILPGIAREVLLNQLHESGQPVREEGVPWERVYSCDRLLLCNSLRGIIPVKELLLPQGDRISFPEDG